jgi:S1-C subfamily serine protease
MAGKPVDTAEADLLYRTMLALLQESRHDPDGLAQVKGNVSTNSAILRRSGFSPLADELDARLRQAEAGTVADGSASGERKPQIVQGTAFAVRPDGMLLTAYHVVEHATRIMVSCPGGRLSRAVVHVKSPQNDLAALKIESVTPDYLSFAAPRSARVGDSVFTVGFPVSGLLGREPKFTEGTISSLSAGGESSVMQVTVPVQPGNSGGALLNNRGEVVGIITESAAIAAFLEATGTLPQNINWAVKSDYALPLFDQPAPMRRSSGKSDAIDRAMKATCLIEATR